MKRVVALCLSLILLILSAGCAEQQGKEKEENLPEKSAEEIKPKAKNEEKPGEIGWAKDVPPVTFKPDWEVETSAKEFLLELTAPKYQGRLTGSAGNRAAADYIEEQFVNFHLQKLPELESYRQSFYDDVFETLPGEAWLVSENGEETALQLGKDWAFRASFVEVDKTLPLSSNLSDCEADKAFLDGNVTKQDYPRKYIEVVSGDVSRNMDHVNFKNSASHIMLTPEIYEQLKQQNMKLHLKLPANAKQGTAENVVGCLPGKDRSKVVVIHANFNGSGQCGTVMPSAYNNASGTAVLLQTAAWLSKAEDLPCDVIFAATNGEMKGAEALSSLLQKKENSLQQIFAVNLKALGWKEEPLTVYGVGKSNSSAKELAGGLQIQYKEDCVGEQICFSGDVMFSVSLFQEACITKKNIWEVLGTTNDTAENLDSDALNQTAKDLCSWIIERGGNRIVQYPLFW